MTTTELGAVDNVLTTTRAVRRKLDFSRPVPPELILECLEIAVQAPTAVNRQNWHFVVVTDPGTKAALARIYRCGREALVAEPGRRTQIEPIDAEAYAVQDQLNHVSSDYLYSHLQDVPGILISCIRDGRRNPSSAVLRTLLASVIPATWSFMLAARARGIGSVYTTAHLGCEAEAAELLGLPYPEVMQCAMVPFGYVIGEPFKPARREPLDLVVHLERW